MKANDPLLAEFSTPSKEDWRAAAEALLKGKPFDKLMKARTPEGIELEPIFWKDVLDGLPATETLPGFDGYLRGTRASGYKAETWEIAQELPYGSPAEFNRAAREDLMRGQNALNVILDIATLKGVDPDAGAPGEVGACGVSLACLKDIKAAFAEIVPEAVGIHIRGGCAGLAVGALYFAWLEATGNDKNAVKGSLNFDPLAVQSAAGALPASLRDLYDEQAALARYCLKEAPGIRSVGVSTLPYHQAGASAVEELGIVLATGAAYLEALAERGLSVDEAARQIRVSLAIGPNFFMELAKIRAGRVLWAKMVAAFGGGKDAQKLELHARTGLYNKTKHDPYVNMLRTTTEALCGAIAGVDSMCVGNFDETARLPDTFSRRISRNTQIILQEECELTDVADPAGGSWAVEWLTHQVAEKAWTFFQEIEGQGGMAEALRSNFLQEKLRATASGVEQRLNQRRMSLVGTNVYPNVEESSLDPLHPDYAELRETRAREIEKARLEMDDDADRKVMNALGRIMEGDKDDLVPALIDAARAGATLGEITRTLRGEADPGEASRPLPAARLAAKYEALRQASANFEAETGRRPLIFLVNFGPLRRHKLRADFTRGFFEAGGFEIISPPGFESPAAAVAALAESDAGIAVVCGTDDDYAERFPVYAEAIKAELPDIRLVLAGHPGDHEDAFRNAGMDDYIFIKSDNYETNRQYLEGLGVL